MPRNRAEVTSALTFAALRHSDFRSLWIGLCASQLGEQMRVFAVGWLVIEIATRDGTPHLVAFFLGLVGLARAVPGLAFGLVGGVLADRLDRRGLLLATQVSTAVVALSLTALAIVGRPSVPIVMMLVAAAATAAAFDLPTQYATLPRLVPERNLMSAVGLTNMAANSAMFVGPLLGGLVMLSTGVAALFALQALLSCVAIAALLRIPALPPFANHVRNLVGSLGEGIAYVARDSLLRWLMWLAIVTALFGRSVAYLFPAVATDVLDVGAVELSWLFAARGIGTLTGSLATASLGGVRRRGVALSVAVLAFGASALAFSAQVTLAPALLLAATMGMAQFTFSGVAGALMQTTAPDALRGRVLSFYLTTVSGVTPIGVLLLGSVGSAIGIELAVAGGAAILIAAAIVALVAAAPLREHRVTSGGTIT